MPDAKLERSIGLLGATGVGVGVIVGGGILALFGVAFAAAGPAAILAFALNGFIAVLTALSFAEMSSAFPESGGTYTFARKVLSVRAAFVVEWDDVTMEIARRAMESDLVILGLQRFGRRRKLFGDLTLRLARNTTCGIIMIGRGG